MVNASLQRTILLIYFLYMVDMLVFKFLWATFCPYTEASVNIVGWCGFADISENIGIRFHHDDGTLGILTPHRQSVEIERHDLCRHQSLLPSHRRMQNMWEDEWQIIGVQWMRCSFWRNCKRTMESMQTLAHTAGPTWTTWPKSMSLSSSGLETQRSETQHSAERILFYTCVSVLDENICFSFVDFFLFL